MQQTANAPYPRLATDSRRRRSLVSLTPLIDVVFILLLFFMLASSFVDWHAIPLNAPAQTGTGHSIAGSILVEVRRDGVRLGGESISPAKLTTRVHQLLRGHPKRRVLVKPGTGVTLQNTVAVLDRLGAAGARNIALIGASDSASAPAAGALSR